MQVYQTFIPDFASWDPAAANLGSDANLVLAFGHRYQLQQAGIYTQLKHVFPKAEIVFASTSGQILGNRHYHEGVALTAIQFESSRVTSCSLDIDAYENSFEAGQALINLLDREGLKHVFVLSDGQFVNGSELVQGMNTKLPEQVKVTGGLAGDDARFEHTLVGLNSQPTKKKIVAIGFYGENLQVSFGSQGGWSAFGPERAVTKSDKNILYALDGQSALDLYKSYLGEMADELPGSALRFPLSIHLPNSDKYLVRTILSVDETDQSMTFAGNLPEGCTARLMKSNAENLIDGAQEAAENCITQMNGPQPADFLQTSYFDLFH
ncbi:MAG: FIST N-terminal domain-containing protein, partial [Bacteroidota bacterium]